jgi:hypothetical protein
MPVKTRTGISSTAAVAEGDSHHADGRMASPDQPLRDHGVRRVARSGDEREADSRHVGGGTLDPGDREQRDPRGRDRGRDGPAPAGPDAVDQSFEHAHEDGAGADRDDRADGDAGPIDGFEKRELVHRDTDASGKHEPDRPGAPESTGRGCERREERAADDDPRGADSDWRRGIGSEGERRAGRPEEHGGEQHLESRARHVPVSQVSGIR